jgi:hypothetical protein
MLEDALAERPGHVSFTEYLDPSSPHFQPEFRAKARELVDAFVPTFGVIALYLYEKDTDGSLADVLAYAIGQGVVGDTLELLNRLMDYDRDNIVLDFMSKMNGTGAILTLMDMIDAIQQAGMLPATVPVLKLLSDRNVFPEFMDLLYVFLPRIRLGE